MVGYSASLKKYYLFLIKLLITFYSYQDFDLLLSKRDEIQGGGKQALIIFPAKVRSVAC